MKIETQWLNCNVSRTPGDVDKNLDILSKEDGHVTPRGVDILLDTPAARVNAFNNSITEEFMNENMNEEAARK